MLNFFKISSLTSSVAQSSRSFNIPLSCSFWLSESFEDLPPANFGFKPSYPSSFHLSCQMYATGFEIPTLFAASSTLTSSYRYFMKYNLCRTFVSFSRDFILFFSSSLLRCRKILIDSGLAIKIYMECYKL